MWDALVNNPWIIWLIIMLILAGIEMLTLDFLFLMMSVAALCAGVVSFFTHSIPLQVVTFAVVAVLLIFLLRPVALNRINRSTPSTRSNAERLVGLSCTGLVRLEGDIWTARSAEHGTLEVGTKAYVYRIDGATAVVSGTAPATTDFSDSPASQPGY